MSKKHAFQVQRWKHLIEERVNSGLTVNAWCDANGITRHNYYYWLAKLREEHYEEAVQNLPATAALTNTFVEIAPDQSPQSQEELQTETNQPAAVIQKGSTRIEILPSASALFMQQLIAAVRHAETWN